MTTMPLPHRSLWFVHPFQMVQYWRAFVATPALPGYIERLILMTAVQVDFMQLVDAWCSALRTTADKFQLRALDPVAAQIDTIEATLQQVASVLKSVADSPGGADVNELWYGVELPMVRAPASVVYQLGSIRNQLASYGAVPEASVTTSTGGKSWLPDWGVATPTTQGDWFRDTLSRVYGQLETSAPGEPRTFGDLSVATFEAAEAAGAAVLAAAKEGVRAAGKTAAILPWAIGIGAVLYLRKG